MKKPPEQNDPLAAAQSAALATPEVTPDALAALYQRLTDGLADLEVQRAPREERKRGMASAALVTGINANATAPSAGDVGGEMVSMPPRDPKRHYTNVPAPVAGQMDSPIQTYLAMESLTQPGYRMYRIESKDPMITGDARVWSLSCLIVDYDEALRRNTRDSVASVRAIAPDRPPAFNGVEGQTYDQIGRVPLGTPGLVGIEPGQNQAVVAAY